MEKSTKEAPKQPKGMVIFFGVFLLICNAMQLLTFTKSYVTGSASVILILYWLVCECVMRQKSAKNVDTKNDKDDSAQLAIYLFIINLTPVIICLFTDFAQPPKHFTLSSLVCIFLMIDAVVLRVSAMGKLKEQFTRTIRIEKGKDKLITDGVYAIVRHPGYAANLIMFVNYYYLATGSFICIAFFLVLFYLNWNRRMNNEEQMMIQHYGDEYKKYMTVTKYRVLPYVY